MTSIDKIIVDNLETVTATLTTLIKHYEAMLRLSNSMTESAKLVDRIDELNEKISLLRDTIKLIKGE